MVGGECPSPGLWPTSGARCRRRGGKKGGDGHRKASTGRSVQCRKPTAERTGGPGVKEAGVTNLRAQDRSLSH